jgi:hypothetical protein
MDNTEAALARLAGVVMLAIGVGLEALCLFVLWRALAHSPLRQAELPVFLILVALGAFCTLVGYRLAFNRPNRYQSVLPPLGWYALACGFAVLGGLLLFVPGKNPHPNVWENAAAAGLCGMFATWCLRAGRITARRGKADPLMPT